jgi:hypothetical protein
MEKKLSIALVAAIVLVVSSIAFVTTIPQVNATIEQDEREERCESHHDRQSAGSSRPERRAAVEQSRDARC